MDIPASGLYNLGPSGFRDLMTGLGKLLIASGIVLVLVGTAVLLVGRVPWLGRLPGDIVIRRDNFMLYIPLASSLLLSVVISFLVYLLRR
jgi:H+/Cl- antiporter ClcA